MGFGGGRPSVFGALYSSVGLFHQSGFGFAPVLHNIPHLLVLPLVTRRPVLHGIPDFLLNRNLLELFWHGHQILIKLDFGFISDHLKLALDLCLV